MRLFALVVLLAGLAVPPTRADEFSATFQFEDFEFIASDAIAYANHPYVGDVDPYFNVAFTDFTIDVQDVKESLSPESALEEQAFRARGSALLMVFDREKGECALHVYSARLRTDPRFHGATIHLRQRFRAKPRVDGRYVAGGCLGEESVDVSSPLRTPVPFTFRAAFEGVAIATGRPPSDVPLPAASKPALALQAFIKAVAGRDLRTVLQHISKDQWPTDAHDPAALDAYFRWLGHAYPSEAVVTAAWVKPAAAMLHVQGRKDGRRVQGSVHMRKVEGVWRITRGVFAWLEWPWEKKQ